jgi:hypothetical protein
MILFLQEREMIKAVASGWSKTWLASDFEAVDHNGSLKLVHGNVFKLAQLVKHQNYGTFGFVFIILSLLHSGSLF